MDPIGKATGELKAEPMSTSQLDRWLSGKTPRRILMLPYGGPIPSKASPLGVDIDGEWFDERTDLFDGHAALLGTRARLTDWHHDRPPEGDPMKGAIVGTTIFDDHAETVAVDGTDLTGRWADFWANAGEQRRALVAALERRGVPLYASTQAAYKKATNGHIDVWPIIRNTISTSPQNTWAVVPPIKAMLAAANLDELPADALKALLVGLDDETRALLAGSDAASVVAGGSAGVKAGRVLSAQSIAELNRVLDLAEKELPALIRALVSRSVGTTAGDTPP